MGKCTQQGATVVDYFVEITAIWDELVNYEKDLDYCHGGQTCARIIDGERQREER